MNTSEGSHYENPSALRGHRARGPKVQTVEVVGLRLGWVLENGQALSILHIPIASLRFPEKGAGQTACAHSAIEIKCSRGILLATRPPVLHQNHPCGLALPARALGLCSSMPVGVLHVCSTSALSEGIRKALQGHPRPQTPDLNPILTFG